MLNKKSLFTLILCSGLAACSTTGQKSNDEVVAEPETEQPAEVVETPQEPDSGKQVEEPTKPETPVVEPEPEVPAPEVTPEPKPEPKPKPLPTKTEEGKLILGQEEWVFIPGLAQHFVAKVDTGATTSSVSAVDIVTFERDGSDWVKFKVQHGDITSKEISLPVLRWAKVKQSNHNESDKRPVVTSWVQIGDYKEKADFTLADRNNMSTPFLLGQSFFRDIAIVDISRKFVQPKNEQ